MKIDKSKFDLALAKNAFSSKEISEKSGVSQVTILRILKGTQEARPSTVGKLAKALGVKVEEIISEV